jgi:aerobic-type carbon monoxide dehydrogenase small subunit (CoxS/CutS family)
VTKELLTLHVNGEPRTVAVEPHHTLLEVLREELGLTGTKHGCELGECGTCTVLVDGIPVLSCLTLPAFVGDADVRTVEGLAGGEKLDPLQTAFAEEGAAQCGYCTPGMLMTARALLDANPRPSRSDIAQAISGNLCRCTGYTAIYEAVEKAASREGGAGPTPSEGGAGAQPLRKVVSHEGRSPQ